jgi:hypothetical protein
VDAEYAFRAGYSGRIEITAPLTGTSPVAKVALYYFVIPEGPFVGWVEYLKNKQVASGGSASDYAKLVIDDPDYPGYVIDSSGYVRAP